MIKKIKKYIRNIFNIIISSLKPDIKPNITKNNNFDVKKINLLAVENCTNSCMYCSTSSQHSKRKSYPASNFYQWLDLLVDKRINFNCIAVTGGEPFLHENIIEFIIDIKSRYPDKKIAVTTNFFWANELSIRKYATPINFSVDYLLISIYPNIVDKLGSIENVNKLISLLKELCQNVDIEIVYVTNFISWEIHQKKENVKNYCITSECFVLRADGKISHCAIGSMLENNPNFSCISKYETERLFDLAEGIDGFLHWVQKYPIKLCYHCTFWKGKTTQWKCDEIE